MANYNLTVAASDDVGTSATEIILRPDSNGYLTYGPVNDSTNSCPVILGNKVYTGTITDAITPYSDTRILTSSSVTINNGTVDGIIVTIINTGTTDFIFIINCENVTLAAGEYFEYIWDGSKWFMINSRYAWWK